MNEEVYLHSIYTSWRYKRKKSLEVFEKILKCNALLSRKNQGLKGSINFFGEDYISLCDYEKRNIYKDNYYNAYYQFVINYMSIIFPKDNLDVIKPVILPQKIEEYSGSISLIMDLGESTEERYSDLDDEVQVKDSVSLDNMSGIMIPSYSMMNFWRKDKKNIEKIKRELELYKELLIKYNKEVPIYDSITEKRLETSDDIKDIILSLREYNKR